MADYRIYPLNPDSSISSASDARCLNDQEALDLAQRLATVGTTSEVWIGTRLVGRVSPSNANDIIQQSKAWMRGQDH